MLRVTERPESRLWLDPTFGSADEIHERYAAALPPAAKENPFAESNALSRRVGSAAVASWDDIVLDQRVHTSTETAYGAVLKLRTLSTSSAETAETLTDGFTRFLLSGDGERDCHLSLDPVSDLEETAVTAALNRLARLKDLAGSALSHRYGALLVEGAELFAGASSYRVPGVLFLARIFHRFDHLGSWRGSDPAKF